MLTRLMASERTLGHASDKGCMFVGAVLRWGVEASVPLTHTSCA